MAFFSEDLHLFAGLSGTEDFFVLWEAKYFSVVSIFDDDNVRDIFQHGFQTRANSSILRSNTLRHLDGNDNTSRPSGESRKVRVRVTRRLRTMWIDLHQLGKVHASPNTQQGQRPRHQRTTTSRRHHIRRSSHSAESRGQFVDQRHLHDRSQSHDFVTGGGHTTNQLQPLRARIW